MILKMFGNTVGWCCGPEPPPSERTFTMKTANIAVFNRDAFGLVHDLLTLSEMVKVCFVIIFETMLKLIQKLFLK